jgi:hypothetical protein
MGGARRISNALAEAAAEMFGVTHDARECGYILPDGRMLDLSGRHGHPGYVRDGDGFVPRRGPDHFAGRRMIDHRELGGLVPDGGTAGMMRFMLGSGAVRVHPTQGFTLAVPPSMRQLAVMCHVARGIPGPAHLEVYDAEGRVLVSEAFASLTPRAVLGFMARAGMLPDPAGDPGGPTP